jgi:arginine N-succinyltransferase
VILRPAQAADANAVWGLLEPSAEEVIGMSSLPGSPTSAKQACADTAETVAALATDSFVLSEGEQRRLLFVAAETDGSLLGLTGVTFKMKTPNLAVQVWTSQDGHGLIMRSTSWPWTRTELDSSFLGPAARGRGVGTLLSRGRLMLLHLVRSQIPSTVAAHLRGRFDPDGSAPFWRHFGAHFAPQWETSTEAEIALIEQPTLLHGLADRRLPLTAPVLECLGPVNDASLPAFHVLRAEGLDPTGMYDPIDGGPTLRAELSDTVTGTTRRHGRAVIATAGGTDWSEAVDVLISGTTVDRFRVTRARALIDESTITITEDAAAALGVGADTLLVAARL